jgi:3-oxoacyl-[acyl-carrier-protein] synthase III
MSASSLPKSSQRDRSMPPIGILGIGVCLPETVRDNSWWPSNVTATWSIPPPADVAMLSEDQREVAAVMERYRADLFQGSQRRRVMAPEQSAMDLELVAAREALANASVSPSDIDLLLTHSGVPDYICTNTACSLHERLGIPNDCFSLSVEASSNSFMMQAALAEQAIRSGAARRALLVQSSTFSRILPQQASYSPWIGDAATAVVVGPVADDHGFFSWQHRTDGSVENTLVAGVPGKRWFDEGRVIAYPANTDALKRMFLSLVSNSKDVGVSALAVANVDASEVSFYASHQGTAWFRELSQRVLGLSNARFVDTWAETASVYSSNIPLCLYNGHRDGLLTRGDIVMMLSGGGGQTYSCGVMKWSL